MICPKCNQQYNAIVAEDGENKGKWICPECKVPLHYSDAGIPPITIGGISHDKVLIDDVEQTLEDKSKETIRSKIKHNRRRQTVHGCGRYRRRNYANCS